MKHLLAKSTDSEEHPAAAETLRGHTAWVVASADKLLARRGAASLAAAGLPAAWGERLNRVVWLAAFCHDLGKCSDHFQAMVRRTRRVPQLVRHEALALWLLWPGGPLAAWARRGVETDVDHALAVLAAAGHHRKFTAGALAADDAGAGTSITLLAGHPDFRHTLRFAAARLGEPPELGDIVIEDRPRAPLQRRLDAWEMEAEPLLRDEPTKRLLAVVKALVLAADVAGSSLPKGREPPAWVDEQLAVSDEAVARKGWERVVETRLAGNALRPFQREVAASAAPITFVRAGCGSGKTLAAYQWAADQHPTRQLWITYPTTGTATEGFRDYLQPTDVPARLDHGRAEVDVDIFHLRDGDAGTRDLDRLDALRNWGADVIACTVDTVLGLVQCQRRGMYAWPGLCHGAVVFDEIHAYDDQLFGSLLRFLEALPGVPALLMTASLPDARRAALEALSEHVHGVPLAVVEGPTNLEELPRYRLRDVEDPWPEVRACLAGRGKVLWVSNTVNRCMDVADAAPADCDLHVYHSRFRYVDRVTQHGKVVDAFKGDGAVLATTTQVAEMSLDLSADLLVTDLAPIPAMIQRLGRLNRRSTKAKPCPVRACLVLATPRPEPYNQARFDEARAWVEGLRGRDLSQRDLVEAWKQPAQGGVKPSASAWLDDGFHTDAAALREASVGVTVLLPDDAARVRAKQARVVEVALPMGPPPSRKRLARRDGGLPAESRARARSSTTQSEVVGGKGECANRGGARGKETPFGITARFVEVALRRRRAQRLAASDKPYRPTNAGWPVVFATWISLRGRLSRRIPAGVRLLVEVAYGYPHRRRATYQEAS